MTEAEKKMKKYTRAVNLINGLLIFVEYLTNPVLTEAGIRLIGTENKFLC